MGNTCFIKQSRCCSASTNRWATWRKEKKSSISRALIKDCAIDAVEHNAVVAFRTYNVDGMRFSVFSRLIRSSRHIAKEPSQVTRISRAVYGI